MKKYLPAFAFILLLAAFLPAAVFGAQTEEPQGHKTLSVDAQPISEEQLELNEEEAQGLPQRLDPRSEAWFADNIHVRDQADTELCWAFAAASAAQISYAKETYDPEHPQPVPELSPAHLGYFFYHRVDDPLGNTPKDRNLLMKYDWKKEGGASAYTYQHLATWSGAGPEENTPFVAAEGKYTGPGSFAAGLAYQNALTLQSSEFYLDLPDTEAGRDTLKNMIDRYGAVVGSLSWSEDFQRTIEAEPEETDPGEEIDTGEETAPAAETELTFFNTNPKAVINHEITIIGWDDSYPKENFVSTPNGDGAWLILDSHGAEEPGGGYVWVSYESVDIMEQGLLGMDMQEADPKLSLYQYDGTAVYDSYDLDAGDTAANVFTAPKNHQIQLDQVGFTAMNAEETCCTITIYAGLTDRNKPDRGLEQLRQEVIIDSPGYKTFELTRPVTIDAGETFAVCVTAREAAGFGTEMDYLGTNDIFQAEAGIQAGQSFYYYKKNHTWYDAGIDTDGSGGYCFRIKAVSEAASCVHRYVSERRVDPKKGVSGYSIGQCSLCGHRARIEIPALKPVPKGTSVTKLVKARKAVTVKWKKSSEKIAGKNIGGYQIRYSLKKTMKNPKKITVKGYKKTSVKITGLKAKKKYYVQIRTYKKTGGKNYYSAWSAVKSVKTK
ncbi:MAG: fibronectin type III domain-containing protein [Firmicutes bacterium]|nr:fibronectin type III domain-containing protein [Bacillota bacterium]